MDPTEPGLYAVSFRIRGYGFQKPQEISKNWDILMLDVFRTRTETGLAPDGKSVVKYPVQEFVARRTIRVSELTRDGWRNYELKFYSDENGLWEYRCAAFDGTQFPDLIQNCGSVKIFFDRVQVIKLRNANVPWG